MDKILLVSCGGLGNGGVQAVMMNIVRKLHNKYQFDIILFTEEKRYYDDEFESYGGKIFRIKRYVGTNGILKRIDKYAMDPILMHESKRIIKVNGPYLAVHCNNEYEAAPILKAAKICRVPIRIIHSHIINSSDNFFMKFVNSLRADTIRKTSTAQVSCSQEAGKAFFGDISNCVIVNNPYDEYKFNSNTETGKFDRLKIIQVGSFSNIKNQLFSIEIISIIKKEYPDVILEFVGYDIGGYLNKMKSRIKELGLEDNIVFYPSNANIAELFTDAACFLFPSLKEGFGIVLIEAQAMGLKCFASAQVPRTTNCGGCTYLDIACGAEYWANAIADFYETTKGEHRTYDVSEFSSTKVAFRIERLYQGEIS